MAIRTARINSGSREYGKEPITRLTYLIYTCLGGTVPQVSIKSPLVLRSSNIATYLLGYLDD